MDNDEELRIVGVDWQRKENTASHHTTEYQTSELVLRRGQNFKITVELTRPLRPKDLLLLHFLGGQKYRPSFVELNVSKSTGSEGWQVSSRKPSPEKVAVTITSPPNAIVGRYELFVKTDYVSFKSEDFFLIFNPWCAEDDVFMPREEERAEYILSDTGYIYMGFDRRIREKPWTFGQFEKYILNCCVFLLGQSEITTPEMNSVVLVSRAICTKMCTVNNGVLMGNWSGNYSDGTAPYVWTSSVPILQQFYMTQSGVYYGQCWVFSGVLTTALRTLGIPARSVTAFQSAHDTDKNLKIDLYVDEMGKIIEGKTKDSVWNFHVWSEAWMKRKDLPPSSNADGWQVLDSTPQEISQGSFRVGPASLNAIRKGEINLLYDTSFVFTEVNGDKHIWQVKKVFGKEKVELISVETMSIGQTISTKAVGENRREDITLLYKYAEGSREEREAMKRAISLLNKDKYEGERHELSPQLRKNDLQISVLEDSTRLGSPITLTLVFKRAKAILQNVNVSCYLDLRTYTGKNKVNLGVIQRKVTLKDQVSFELPLTMDTSSYINYLDRFDDEVFIKGLIIAETVESNEKVATEVLLSFLYPDFSIEMPSTARVGQPLRIICTFKNTLTIPLTNIRFSVESLGISSVKNINQAVVMPGKSIQFQMSCVPVRTGPKKFIIQFMSKQVKEVHAEKIVLVTN